MSPAASRAPSAAGTVAIDGVTGALALGQTLFDAAESLGVSVPTSCLKQGKCRECLVEVEAGASLLSPPAPQESPSGRPLPAGLPDAAPGAGRGTGHTLKRGSLRIETETAGLEECLPALDPAVTREGHRVLLDGSHLADADGPLHGLAVDIGTTTVALRLYDLEAGRLRATQSFENPQRFGGSDIMARIHYDGTHKGRLLQRTLLGYLSRSIVSLPVDPIHHLRDGGGRRTPRCATCSSASMSSPSASCRIARPPRRRSTRAGPARRACR